MELSVLVATMFLEDVSILQKLNLKSDSIIVNQTDFSKYPEIFFNEKGHKILSVEDRGLSKSRNLAIDNCQSSIAIVADEDVQYLEDYPEIIKEAYTKFPDADVILFDFYRENNVLSKSIAKSEGKLNLLQSLRGNSVRITFKVSSINKAKIRFNENFGSGSNRFIASEDLVFMTDCYKKGLKIYYVPKPILRLRESESTWFKGYTPKFFETIGGFSYHLMGNFWFLFALQFLVRHRNLFKGKNIVDAFYQIKNGVRQYKQIK